MQLPRDKRLWVANRNDERVNGTRQRNQQPPSGDDVGSDRRIVGIQVRMLELVCGEIVEIECNGDPSLEPTTRFVAHESQHVIAGRRCTPVFGERKEAMSYSPIGAEGVAWREGEQGLPVVDLLALINCFRKDDLSGHPIESYSAKSRVVEAFRLNPESSNKVAPLLPDLCRLMDAIRVEGQVPTLSAQQATLVCYVSFRKKRRG